MTKSVPTQAGQGWAAESARESIARSELWQEPHWSPMPQRCRSRRDSAPLSMAFVTSRSDFPRQIQTITCLFPNETESQYACMMRPSFPFVKSRKEMEPPLQ